ncbi:hypothetical protein ScPMuIL_004575 [Solemya velum]
MTNHVALWQLPEEVMTYMLKGLHIKVLLNISSVHPYFRDNIDNNTSLWENVSFNDTWLCVPNLRHFEKAAEMGNIAALVKLALAYLYREGFSENTDITKVAQSGSRAANMFCKVEERTHDTEPFMWLFIRPPWSASGACCKGFVFNSMAEYLQQNNNSNVEVCVAKIMLLLDDDQQKEAERLLQQAAENGSGTGAFLVWQLTKKTKVPDRAEELELIRQLRNISRTGNLDAKLSLCRYYASGKYGGISQNQAATFVHSLSPCNVFDCLKDNDELTPSMRHILIDWLAEVAGIKEFSSQTLHVAVSVIDRYLKLHKIPRHQLQLLGVVAMVLCTRFLGKNIMTIREAAWLTDNTYKYEDIVRMMGEITATLKGKIRVPTSLDFVEIFSILASLDKKTSCLAEYICEVSLQRWANIVPQKSPLVLYYWLIYCKNKMMNRGPRRSRDSLGFLLTTLADVLFTYMKNEGAVVDHRDITLEAIKQRYSEEQFHRVGETEIMNYAELCLLLGVTEHIVDGPDVRVKFRNEDELVVSPSKKRSKRNIKKSKKEVSFSTLVSSSEYGENRVSCGGCMKTEGNPVIAYADTSTFVQYSQFKVPASSCVDHNTKVDHFNGGICGKDISFSETQLVSVVYLCRFSVS